MSDYFDLGSYRFPVTTASTEAQVWFDRRLAWTYGFNHEEAVACFEKVLGADSGCCMGHRGLAYAVGPNRNKPWADFGGEERAACLFGSRLSRDLLARRDCGREGALRGPGLALPRGR